MAAYIGNIVGALFVALPAVYFYLSDYNGDGLCKVEEGEKLGESTPTLNCIQDIDKRA